MGFLTYTSLLLYLPFLVASGVRSWPPIVAFVVLCLAAAVMSLIVWKSSRPNPWFVDGAMLFSNLGMACTGAFFGALLMAPAVIAINTTPYALYTKGVHRRIAMITSLLLVAGLIVTGMLGGLPVEYHFTGDTLVISAGAIGFVNGPTTALLIAIALGHVITNIGVVSRIQSDLQYLEVKTALHAWNLEGLAPGPSTDILDSAVQAGRLTKS